MDRDQSKAGSTQLTMRSIAFRTSSSAGTGGARQSVVTTITASRPGTTQMNWPPWPQAKNADGAPGGASHQSQPY